MSSSIALKNRIAADSYGNIKRNCYRSFLAAGLHCTLSRLRKFFANTLTMTIKSPKPEMQPMHVYEVRPRREHRGVDLISVVLPFGRLWYDTPDNAIGYAM